tara:strand:- start:912 stop:1538 length:627 start_codon:yes stop_codon:yes gene_type:complete
MRLIILLFFLISSFISAQEEKKRNGLKNLLKQAEKLAKDLGLDDKKKETKDFFFSSIDIGKTSFSTADRIAIKDVIDAYGFYWDTNNLDGYLSLFTDSAKGVVINVDGSVDNNFIKSDEQVQNSKNRMDYFIKNQMQRRHMMANSFFIELTNDYAHLRQYMILMTTNNKEKTEILTPINYVFKLIKLNGIWKIIYREINLDKPLDLSL